MSGGHVSNILENKKKNTRPQLDKLMNIVQNAPQKGFLGRSVKGLEKQKLFFRRTENVSGFEVPVIMRRKVSLPGQHS